MKKEELWRQIPSFPTYAASDLGRIKNIKKNKIMAIAAVDMTRDYQRVCISYQGKKYTKKVARLVWEAFVGCPCSLTINHIDGNPLNNKLNNLECISNKENCAKKNIYRNKESRYGLTDEIRIEMLNQYSQGKTAYFLSKKYGLPSNYLYTTFSRGSWNHLCWKDDIENTKS